MRDRGWRRRAGGQVVDAGLLPAALLLGRALLRLPLQNLLLLRWLLLQLHQKRLQRILVLSPRLDQHSIGIKAAASRDFARDSAAL